MRATMKWALFGLFIFTCTQCQKQELISNSESVYFKVNFVPEPQNESLLIDDTLWITSTIPDYLLDTASNNYFNVNEASISMSLVLRVWRTEEDSYPTDIYSFSFDDPGMFVFQTKNATVFDVKYSKSGTNYVARFGVIFKKEGIYSIDADYLKYINISNHSTEYYGGGTIVFSDSAQVSQSGYLLGCFDTEIDHIKWYSQLSEEEKQAFQPVNDKNEEKYYFIKIDNR